MEGHTVSFAIKRYFMIMRRTPKLAFIFPIILFVNLIVAEEKSLYLKFVLLVTILFAVALTFKIFVFVNQLKRSIR